MLEMAMINEAGVSRHQGGDDVGEGIGAIVCVSPFLGDHEFFAGLKHLDA
ncbi:MAG: hypothetical protein M1393_02910 [Candidatus Thermoplasmatota archaeon]|nr:hypothetical protein [Candidatus Thermoplasmatota archaeon]